MKRIPIRAIALVAVAALTLSLPLSGAVAAEAAAVSGFKTDLGTWMSDAESKLLQLAEATPADKYGWRPAEGVRSQGEVFLHVAAANFGLPNFWGVTPPEGFKFEGYEQSITSKADIQAALKASFAHVKASLQNLPEADFDRKVTVFGNEVTVRWGYMLLLSHQHEHLGQSIAYARSNAITPPWSAAQNEAVEQGSKTGGE